MRESIVTEVDETPEVKVTTTQKPKSKKTATAPADKKESLAGRKKVSASQKKKARQVFYSDDEFEDILKCAEIEILDVKAFMQRAINKEVKALLREEEIK